MCSNLRIGSRRDEELVYEVPVLAELIITSQKVCVLFLRPPSFVGPSFPSRRQDQARKARRRKESEQTTMLSVFSLERLTDHVKVEVMPSGTVSALV